MPLFEKSDSRGEFVFDWGWAAALARTGREYYPKLVAAIPYTPVPGRRLLIAPGAPTAVAQRLAEAALAVAQERNLSSLHWLFTEEAELETFESAGCILRNGCDFVWRNPGVADFNAWLATLTAARRKKIHRERRRIVEAGIVCDWVHGPDLSEAVLHLVYQLYSTTYYQNGMYPYLAPTFFAELSSRLADNLTVCFARHGGEIIACAIFLTDDTTLYGRYWGSFEWVDSLHFELCYYQGIEYALAHELATFHPGVQGEHKLLRGFEPTLHHSAHWLRDEDMRLAVTAFLSREREAVNDYAARAAEYLPFRHDKG